MNHKITTKQLKALIKESVESAISETAAAGVYQTKRLEKVQFHYNDLIKKLEILTTMVQKIEKLKSADVSVIFNDEQIYKDLEEIDESAQSLKWASGALKFAFGTHPGKPTYEEPEERPIDAGERIINQNRIMNRNDSLRY